ncbi:MAG: LysR family transcriptional regulator [Coriobacteriia bacterium]|jgi:molybdate transport system regulatory protein|nr:LysR family transcriptional regulator [Coriobacteriia bacterium]MDR2714622.1 LysR family transcriptional regulator [Coriobacteriales bacterium]
MKSMKKLGVKTRLTIYSGGQMEHGTLGKGVATLMRGVVETGSLNAAAKNIKMAYSKAWRIFKETEAAFGFQLINRDGARGSTLTQEGEKLLVTYEQLEAEAEALVSKRFSELIR